MVTIAHISDLHFGRHSVRVTESLLDSLAQNAPDLVVVSGDLTQRATPSQFVEARRFLQRLAFPKLVVPGNHDLPLYHLVDRLFRPLRNYDRYIAPLDQQGSFYSSARLAVLGLNTSRRLARKNGRISLGQISSIKKLFASAPPKAFKAVVTHHPFAFSGSERVELAERAGLALEALASAGVRLLMSGHHHAARSGELVETTTRHSLLIVHAGTAVSTRLRRGEANSYNLLTIEDGLVSVRVMEWGPGQAFVPRKDIRHFLTEANASRAD